MFNLLGILLIVVALSATGWWVAGDRAHKPWVFTVCLAAIFAGAFLILQDRATEITLKGVGTIKSAAERATSDAKAVAALRERVEAQSATVDAVAQRAKEAHDLAETAASQTTAAAKRLEAVDAALSAANQRVAELDKITEFTRTVVAAQNDDRGAFDQLELWANDESFPMREGALNSWRTILDD